MRPNRVVMAPTARRQLLAAVESWAARHPQRPLVLLDEFDEVVRHFETLPSLGALALGLAVPDLRRILLVRSDHHLYSTVDASQRIVELLAVWYARRGTLPDI